MSLHVYIVEEDCVGCGMCETTCPEVFLLVDDVSTVIKPEGGPEDAIRAAMDHCPGSCILIKE